MTKAPKLSKAKQRTLEKRALRLVASMGKALEPRPAPGTWFAPTGNSDALQKQNPLIGHDTDDTLRQVNCVIALVQDAALCESRLDDSKQGTELVLRLVRDAITKQVEFMSENSLLFTLEQQAQAKESRARVRAQAKARRKAVQS